jgi:hypothetical protein
MKKRNASTLLDSFPEEPVTAPIASRMRPLGAPEVDFPLADAFFSEAVARRTLSHGYILKGPVSGPMYRLALQIARIVNCRRAAALADSRGHAPEAGGSGRHLADLACGECTDCRWVEQNAHPAVLTISRLTYLVSETGGDLDPDDLEKMAKKGRAATQIKTEQVDRLLAQLGLSSEATRVVIFTDAEEWPSTQPADVTAPFEWRSVAANHDKSFHIRPLERRLFNHASANRFLKTLEEPPPRTLFFFITETEEQILETIVSRCQVIPCRTARALEAPLSVSEADRVFLRGFIPRLSTLDAVQATEEFEAFFIRERGLTTVQALDTLQRYLWESYREQARSSSSQEAGFFAYRRIQEQVDAARRQIDDLVNESQALFNLFLAIPEGLKRESGFL